LAWTIEFKPQVEKDLKKLDKPARLRVLSFLSERVARLNDPRSLGEALQGAELGKFWKYRVGDYRIICDIQDSKLVVLVLRVGNRRDVYR
jgi:mRNA interferase RelE/StbE